MRTADIDKKRQIIRIVEEFASKRDFHEITVDQVAHAAQVGKGTIYRYFKDKNDLFDQAAAAGLEQVCAVLTVIEKVELSFGIKLQKTCQEINQFFARKLKWQRLTQQAGGFDREPDYATSALMRAKRDLVPSVARILEQGRKRILLRGDVSVETLAEYLLGLLWINTDHREQGEDVCRPILEFFLHGAENNRARITTYSKFAFNEGSDKK